MSEWDYGQASSKYGRHVTMTPSCCALQCCIAFAEVRSYQVGGEPFDAYSPRQRLKKPSVVSAGPPVSCATTTENTVWTWDSLRDKQKPTCHISHNPVHTQSNAMPTPGGISLFMQPLPEKTEPSEDEASAEPEEEEEVVEVEPEKVGVNGPATEEPEKVVQKPDSDEQQLVTRLITRIAELEEKLYQKDLDQPVRPGEDKCQSGGQPLRVSRELERV